MQTEDPVCGAPTCRDRASSNRATNGTPSQGLVLAGVTCPGVSHAGTLSSFSRMLVVGLDGQNDSIYSSGIAGPRFQGCFLKKEKKITVIQGFFH